MSNKIDVIDLDDLLPETKQECKSEFKLEIKPEIKPEIKTESKPEPDLDLPQPSSPIDLSELSSTCEFINIDKSKNACRFYISGGFCSHDWMFRCVEWLKRNTIKLSYSFMRDFIHCHRKCYHGQIQGLQLRVPSLPLIQGRIASKVLSQLHDKKFENEQLNIRQFIKSQATPYLMGDSDNPDLPQALESMTALFEGYVEKEMHTVKGVSEFYFRWEELDYPRIHGYVDLMQEFILSESGKPTRTIAYEFKYTKSPDWYSKFNLMFQLGTYFLGNPELERITARIIQAPQMRMGKNENLRQFHDRVKDDIVRRIGHYVNDSNYWRTEYNYEAIKQKARKIVNEITTYIPQGIEAWYQDDQACFSPPCEFFKICDSGVVSETLYKKREMRDNDKKIPLYTGKDFKSN